MKLSKKNHNKIIFFSPHIKKGYENTDLEFANYLKDFVKFDFYYGSYSLKKKGYNFYFLKKIDKKYKKLNPKPVRDFYQLKILLTNFDTLIISSLTGIVELVSYAKKIGLNVIVIDKYFNYDFNPNINADLFIFKNLYALKRYKIISDDFSKEKNDFKISGALQSIHMSEKYLLSKKKFLKKYKIKKKIALILLTGIQHQDNWYKKKITNIINFLKLKKFHILIKRHPNENLKRDFKNKKFFKNYPTVDENDFYSVIKQSNIIISISTNAYQEVNLMGKPIIYIEKDTFNIPHVYRNDFVNIRNYINVKWRSYSMSNEALKYFNFCNKKNTKKLLKGEQRKRISGFIYYGLECEFNFFVKNFNQIFKNYKNGNISLNNQKIKALNNVRGNNLLKINTNYLLNFLRKQEIKKNDFKVYFDLLFMKIIYKIKIKLSSIKKLL